MNNILLNKKKLEIYLSDFSPLKKEEILKKFEGFDFNCGCTSFLVKMKRIISMPKFGKRTLIYWKSRGWSEEESLMKRVSDNRDPESSPMNINFWINRGLSKNEAEFKVKSQRKFNKEYWIINGFKEDDAIERCKEFQRENSKKFHIKLKENDDFRNSVNCKRKNNINYWINSGLNLEESRLKLKERQSTFSKNKCIAKYGEDIGVKIWNQRQEKWKNSLSLSLYNGRDRKDSKTIDFFKKSYGTNWIEKYLCKISFKNRDEILYLTSFKDYKEMINTLANDKYKLGDISYLLKYKIIEEIYSTSTLEMLKYLVDNYEFNYGTLDFYKKNYDDWVDKFIQDNSFKNKDEIKFLISFKNYRDLIEYMINNYRMTDIMIYLKGKLIPFYYQTTFKEMFNYLISVDPTIKSKFGRMRYYNNHICRSDSEYIIAKFLVENEIAYEYEKKYKNTLKKCDFYLTKYDFYIEYTGMYKIASCKKNYEYKKKYCIENKIKCLFSSRIEEIEEKIKELNENKSIT